MDQDLTQIGVAALADPKQLRLATGRVLPWHEPEPRREVSPLAERGAVPNGGNQSGRNNGPDAWDLPNATATCVARSNLLKPVGQFIDLLFDCLPLVAGGAGAGRTLAGSLQHYPSTLFARVQIASTRDVATRSENRVWRSGKQSTLSTSPHPRRRRDTYKNQCATLTIQPVQKIGQTTRILKHAAIKAWNGICPEG